MPSGGEDNNPACDAQDSFGCYGVSPTDANAFCTVFDCQADSDCPGGWWCATVNAAPNVTTTTPSFGKTRAVCLPREYCAVCQMDHDCPRAADGATQQHCVSDPNGGGFCTPQCGTTADCKADAICTKQWGVCAQATCKADSDCNAGGVTEKCFAGTCGVPCARDADCPPSNGAPQHCASGACVTQACQSDDDCPPTAGTYQHCNAGACTPECGSNADCNPAAQDQTCVPLSVCVPRAGTCLGDGSFCSPCRSDADCADGYCLSAPYSEELFCSQKAAAGPCTADGAPNGACPTPPNGANYKGVSCTATTDDFAPVDQCVGVVTFGTSQDMPVYTPGCWTLNR
jgi:hypothetical protein